MQEGKVIERTDLLVPLLKRGKVREVYDLDNQLLIVASDRVSAFDVVMPNPIPGKGKVLTSMSAFWFRLFANLPSHYISTNLNDAKNHNVWLAAAQYDLEGRSMIVKKADPLPFEAVVRGYLAGSGLDDYRQNGKICGISLPVGLMEGSKLPQPIFTPSTKAETGHDENIDLVTLGRKLDEWLHEKDLKTDHLNGQGLAAHLLQFSLMVYKAAAAYAFNRGIIIADTKIEFGWLDGRPVLIDELLTPDSSRFWPVAGYKAGQPQPSFDKQFLRDYLKFIHWDRKPPAPELPPDVIQRTREKYLEARIRLTS